MSVMERSKQRGEDSGGGKERMVLERPILYLSSFISSYCKKGNFDSVFFFETIIEELFGGLLGVGFLESYYVIIERKTEREVLRVVEALRKKYGDLLKVMVDSGAYSLFQKYVMKGKRISGIMDRLRVDYSWADNQEVQSYFRRYVDWLKGIEKDGLIDEYVVLDVIGNPELSWRNWLRMKDEGLNPLPVIHAGTELDWVEKYLKYIGEGDGFVRLGVSVKKNVVTSHYWLDVLANWLDRKVGLDRVKMHGFAVTDLDLIKKYRFWSVDTASWAITQGFGKLLWFSNVRKKEFAINCNKYIKCGSFDLSCSKTLSKFFGCISNDSELKEEFLNDVGVVFRLIGLENELEYVTRKDIASILEVLGSRSRSAVMLLSALFYVRKWKNVIVDEKNKGGEGGDWVQGCSR